jgi:hypothetical protein
MSNPDQERFRLQQLERSIKELEAAPATTREEQQAKADKLAQLARQAAQLARDAVDERRSGAPRTPNREPLGRETARPMR